MVKALQLTESIVATIREPLVLLDADLRVVLANRSFFRTFQANKEQTYGRLIYQLGHKQWDIPRLRQLLENILPDSASFEDFEVAHDFPGIGRRVMLLNARKIYRETEKEELILLAIEDITERKEAENQIRELNEELTYKNLHLEATNRELEAYNSTVSHDLKNPLVIMGNVTGRLIKKYGEKLDAKGKEYLDLLQSTCTRMTELVDDLLELSQVSKIEMKAERVDLSSLAKMILKEYLQKDPSRSIEYRFAEECFCEGDRSLLRVALDNLLGNAWKFTRDCAHARIEFGCFQEEGKTIYFVRDNGCGFDLARPERLFMPFQRFHKAEDYPGTGIGLASVNRIINRHGGRIWAESSIGNGAVFYFTLSKIME